MAPIIHLDEHFMPKTAFASKYRYNSLLQVFISISCLKQHFMLNTPLTCKMKKMQPSFQHFMQYRIISCLFHESLMYDKHFMQIARKYWSYIAFHALMSKSLSDVSISCLNQLNLKYSAKFHYYTPLELFLIAIPLEELKE